MEQIERQQSKLTYPEIFFNVLFKIDSFIEMRDLMVQTSKSIPMNESMLQLLSQKFCLEYIGGGKDIFLSSISGMSNLDRIMSNLSMSNKKQEVFATITLLPKAYFEIEDKYYNITILKCVIHLMY